MADKNVTVLSGGENTWWVGDGSGDGSNAKEMVHLVFCSDRGQPEDP